MIIEAVKEKEPLKFEDLPVGATFYLSIEGNSDLYLKTKSHPNTSVNCVNLVKSTLCVCGIKSPVIEIKTKVVNA